MEKVRHILQKHFPETEWNIALSTNGQHRTSYIAQCKEQQVFIKFDVPIDAIQRLGEIEVAPRILASGIYEGLLYVVQEYINGRYPDWRWFANHLPYLATFIHRYHYDGQLSSLLSRTMTTNYAGHVALDIATLETRFRSLEADDLQDPEIFSAFEELKTRSKNLQPVQLVPTHPDPNTKNMLLLRNRLFMVDWDNMQLSDPLRDISLILWWYVSPQQWPIFFQAYGVSIDECLIEKIYWWIARTSFGVALWHVEHNKECAAFLHDFIAALNKSDNPRAVFSN